MPKYKALHTIGVAHLLGSHQIQNADGLIPNGAKLELSEELVNLIGADSFEKVDATSEEKPMSEEVKPTEPIPAVQPDAVAPDQTPAPTEGAPVTPETPVTPPTEPIPAA